MRGEASDPSSPPSSFSQQGDEGQEPRVLGSLFTKGDEFTSFLLAYSIATACARPLKTLQSYACWPCQRFSVDCGRLRESLTRCAQDLLRMGHTWHRRGWSCHRFRINDGSKALTEERVEEDARFQPAPAVSDAAW
eukprot:scaffold4079_cov392-Prasinococcus_capsulatus_cf.AAC.9